MKFRSFLKSLSRRSKHQRCRHAALVAKGNAIYAVTVNIGGHHAEASALVRAGENARGATLYTLMTRTKDETLGIGDPCHECMGAIKRAGIRKVVVYLP